MKVFFRLRSLPYLDATDSENEARNREKFTARSTPEGRVGR
jgi:hypothetical protein